VARSARTCLQGQSSDGQVQLASRLRPTRAVVRYTPYTPSIRAEIGRLCTSR
jgi:hypothetical protein